MADLTQRIVEAGLVTREQIDAGRLEAVRIDRSLWFALMKLDYLSEEGITRFFAHEARIPYVSLHDYRIKQSVLNILDEHFCRRYMVIPLWLVKDTLFVACNNPFDTGLMDTIRKLSRCVVEPLMAESTAITHALDSYWKMDDINFDIANFLVSPEPVKGLASSRGSARITIDWPVSVEVRDTAFSLAVPARIEGRMNDLSQDGSAIGISCALYLPKGLMVSVRIFPDSCQKPGPVVFEASGEVVQSYMNKTRDYSVGIRFASGQDAIEKSLLDRALKQSNH
jgi:hypothetical protein